MSEIQEIPTEEIKVDPKPSGIKSKIGEEDFMKGFIKLIRVGPVWRTSKKMAELLGVDPIDLSTWMDKQVEICKRPGKEEGIVYYGLVSRLEQPKEEKRVPGMERKQVTEEDRYFIAMLHQNYGSFVRILEKYALHVHTRNKESFAALVESRDRMSAGISLYVNTIQADVTKLPKL